MGYIYKITNQINGKLYIGKTELANPYDRWMEHKKDYNRRKFEKRPLYSAMKKYGVDNFIFEIIDKADNSDKLCELEKFYIEKFRTYVGYKDCNGYNATLGGDGKSYLKFDEVVRVHIENNYIVSRTAKYYGVDPSTIQKILLKHNIKWLDVYEAIEMKYKEEYGGLIQFDSKMSKVLNIYDSPKHVLDINKNYKERTLRCATRPKHPTHYSYGYRWYRLYELPEEYKPLLEEYYKTQKEEKTQK